MLISLEFITNRISFGTHVATVRDYLNWYRVADSKERQNGSTMFAEYLVSACWRKMERRIGHWASVGLMQQLHAILPGQLSSSPIDDQSSQNATRSDFRLSVYLRALGKADNLKKILACHQSFFNLIGSNKKQLLPYLQLRSLADPHNLYNTDTFSEFHHLLVASLIYYAISLRKLRIFHTVDMGIGRLIKLIIDYEKKPAKELKKHNANVAFEHFGIVEESEERKEGNLETKDPEFSVQLKSLIDKEVNAMSSLDDVDTGKTEEEKLLKKISMLKSCLDGKLKKMPLSLDDVTPEAAEEAKKGEGMEKNLELLTKLKSYFDMKYMMLSSLSATNRKDKLTAVFLSGRFLNALLVSGAFQRHIEILVNRRLLAFPNDGLQGTYRSFAGEKRIPWRQSRGGLPQTVVEIGNADLDPEEDQDFIMPGGDVALAIQGWAKLFVKHHHAKSILETFLRREGHEIPIEIKVYGVSLPEKRLPLPTWETLKTVMRSSLQDKTAEDRDKMINVFKSYFETSDDTNDNDIPCKNVIYNVIGNIITQKANTTRYYNIHCEVALAGLVAASKFPSEVARFVDKDLLDELNVGIPSILQLRQLTHMYLQKMRLLMPKEVAVSKLCCPVCWKYFDILSKRHIPPGHREYKIRGRHSTLFPVQLPIWTTTDVVQELIRRFGRYLRTELDTMWSDHLQEQSDHLQEKSDHLQEQSDHLQEQIPRARHRNTPSFQSVSSAISDASTNSGESNPFFSKCLACHN